MKWEMNTNYRLEERKERERESGEKMERESLAS